MRQNINFGKLLHGGDYNPEQWLEYPEILEQMERMYFQANDITLGAFHAYIKEQRDVAP